MSVEHDRVFLSSPHMSDEGYERQYIQQAFDSNWIAPLGKNVDMFEKEIVDFVGASAAVALNSGTSAIHLALKSAGVRAGDKVFCQTLTFAATANPIIYQNGVPVFIDSERGTWNMSPELLEKAFALHPDVKVVEVVHLYGIAAKIDQIREICNRHGALLIEDAAESLGTTVHGKYTGTFGDYGIFSFNGNKIITTSGGGMLLVNTGDQEKQAKKIRFWSMQSRDPGRYFQHSELGYNYRLSNVSAGIGRGQLRVLAERIQQKRHIFLRYSEELSGLDGVAMMPAGAHSNCWLSCMYLSGKVTPADVIRQLDEHNIESRPIWKPMHLQPYYEQYEFIRGEDSVAEDIFEHGVCLPSDTKLTDADLDRIIGIIQSLWA